MLSSEEITVEWTEDGKSIFKVFETDDEAIEFAHKELGYGREWTVSAYRFIDANYVNYN